MRESTLSFDKQRNAAVRRVIGWQKDIETRRQLHLATLKEMRHDWNALEKRLREIIDGDQLELFPGADVGQPRCLLDTETLWTLLMEKDLELRLFRIDVPGENPAFFMDAILSDKIAAAQAGEGAPNAPDSLIGPIGRRLTRFVGSEKGQAMMSAVMACTEAIAGGTALAKKLHKALDKLLTSVPPPVAAIDPNRVLPTAGTHEFREYFKGRLRPVRQRGILATLEDPELKPDLFYRAAEAGGMVPGGIYVAVSLFGGAARSCFVDTTAVRVMRLEEWRSATVTSADKAFDGHRLGFKFLASDGEWYVCLDWTTAIRLVRYKLWDPRDFQERGKDPAVLTAAGFKESASPWAVEEALQGVESGPEAKIIVGYSGRGSPGLFLIAAEPTGGGTSAYPPNCMMLLRLVDLDNFECDYPTFQQAVPSTFAPKESCYWIASLGGRRINYGGKDYVIGPIETAILVNLETDGDAPKPKRAEKAKKSAKPDAAGESE